MTDSRRAELDLETLWKGILKKSLRENKQARGEKINSPEELEQLLASKIQLPKSGSALQWQALQNASQQRRAYTTSARRLSPDLMSNQAYHSAPLGSRETDIIHAQEDVIGFGNLHAESNQRTLAKVREWFEELQLAGQPLTPQMIRRFVRSALTGPASEPAAKERLSLVDQVLWTAEERGVELWDHAMFTSLIEGFLLSPSFGQRELERAQRNIEALMDQSDCLFDTTELLRMMTYYAKREDWPRFWEAFRKPHLHNLSRPSRLYTCAYNALANTNNQIMCIENLRWIYTEMRNEEWPISMTGEVYQSLKKCIRVCDPAAEYLLKNGAEYLLRNTHLGESTLSFYSLQRFKNREYLNMLREVEVLHTQDLQQGLSNRPSSNTAEENLAERKDE
jgi:hypothetical protein